MKIVAFLQNMWVHPKSVASVERFAPTSRERERMIAYALFAGCKTGRVLKATLGAELCERIIWQEANPTIADNPKDYYPPDREHIKAVLDKHQPDAVLCLTRAGQSVIFEIAHDWAMGNVRKMNFVSAPHPVARGANVPNDLREAAMRLTSSERAHQMRINGMSPAGFPVYGNH